jgi:regulator of sigma E protease
MNILIFFVILLVLVLVHEFGHFITAKKFGIRVDEFGFGFPPKLFGVKKGETEYTFNLLPIGGFVKIFGENPDDENTYGPDAARSFINKPKWQQAVVLVAGVVANFLLAWLFFSIGFMSGLPTSVGIETSGQTLSDVKLTVLSVAPKSPAETAGLKSGDKIVFIKKGNKSTTYISPETVSSFVRDGGEVEIGYLRAKDTTENHVKIIPEKKDENQYVIGISMDMIGISKLPFFASFWEGAKLTLSVAKSTFLGLFSLVFDAIRGQGSLDAVTGPVGMVGIAGDAYEFGFVYLLSFAALISVNLGIINLLPFPALDGGRLFFLLIEKIKGSALSVKFTNSANTVGFCVLLLLMLVVTFHDIAKLF